MLVLAFVLFSSLVLKDTTGIPFEQYLRVVAEVIVGAYGVLWLFRNASNMLLRKYWIFFIYLSVLGATALFAARPTWVVFQTLSLGAIFAFFIAFVEQQQDLDRSRRLIFALVAIEFSIACFASLVLYVVNAQAALDTSVEPWRYKGVFGKPGGAAAAAGLLVVIALFSCWRPALRVGAATVGLVNLALSGSRTALAAAIISAVTTVCIYSKRRLVLLWAAATAITAVLYVHLATGLGIPESVGQAMRLDTVETLSGRTDMWSRALDLLRSSPVLGYGFTLGSDGFDAIRLRIVEEYGAATPMAIEGGLLDNGYIQSLMDSGVAGFAIYIMIIVTALYGALRQLKAQDTAALFACLIFIVVGNVGESLIFAAATPHSVFFWYLAILAVGLNWLPAGESRPVRSPGSTGTLPSKPAGVPPGQSSIS